MNDVLSVGVVLREDEGFRDECASGKEVGEQRLLESLENRADLRRNHHGTVNLGGRIAEILVEPLPASLTRLLAAFVHVKAFFDLPPFFGDLRFDPIDIVPDIHSIGHGALVVVFHHEVLVEKADGLLRRRGSKPDQEGIEIFKHLPPEIVDRPMAFVGDNGVERLDWDGRIVFDVFRARVGRRHFKTGFFVDVLVEFLTAQNRIESLDGADRHTGDGIKLAGGEMLDIVKFGELSACIGRHELLELGERLATKVGAIHQKENALCSGMLDQPVGERTCCVGLARASRHLDQSARVIGGERLLQICDSLDLAFAHPVCRQGKLKGHLGQFSTEGCLFGDQSSECVRAVK